MRIFDERIFGDRVQELVEALCGTLDASIDLIDWSKSLHHVAARNDRWLSARHLENDAPMSGTCVVRVSISDRWTLCIFRKGWLHHDVVSIAAWAAAKVAKLLPEREQSDPTYPPAQGGGGTSGSAELGIPLSWVRKTQN